MRGRESVFVRSENGRDGLDLGQMGMGSDLRQTHALCVDGLRIALRTVG